MPSPRPNPDQAAVDDGHRLSAHAGVMEPKPSRREYGVRIQLTVRRGEGRVLGDDDADGDRQVVVECAPGTRADALAAALADQCHLDLDLGARDRRHLVIGGRVVTTHTAVGMPPLLTGAVVELRHTWDRGAEPRAQGTTAARWELRVDSGPDMGRRFVLPPVASVMGRERRSAVCLSDPGVSRRHAEVSPTASGVRVRDLGGANGTSVNGRRVGSGPLLVAPGDRLRLGGTSVSVHPLVREARHLPGDGEGRLLVEPVLAPPRPAPVTVTMPAPPPDPQRSRFPWLALLVPLVLAGVLALVMRSPTMLLFGLSGPVLSLGTWVTTRRGSRRHTRDERARSLAARRAAELEAERARAEERDGLTATQPTLARLLTAAETRSRDLWARPADRSAPGPLDVRLGVGSPPSRVHVVGETTRVLLADAPVTVDLIETDLVAVLGSRTSVLRAATNLVGRLAAQHAPHRVEIYVMVGSVEHAADWSFARLLPHVTEVSVAPARAVNAAATSPSGGRAGENGRAGRVGSSDGVPWLGPLAATATPPGTSGEPFTSTLGRSVGDRDPPTSPARRVVVLDGGPALLRTPAARTLLRLASESRIALVTLGRVPVSQAATARTAVINLDGPASGALTVGSDDPVPFAPDLPGTAYAWQLARALAPLCEVDGAPAAAVIPHRVRLLDLISPDLASRDPDNAVPASSALAQHLTAEWTRRPRSTRALLGVTRQGRFELDLEVDGPHVLVGGTTGSGKSELLQTLVTSLAMANRPDEMAFVLVDYKGGAAFRGCAELPHVVGWVTDLDAHLTRRALLSLSAEVRRRERILASAGVPDLAAYQRRRDLDRSTGAAGADSAPDARTALPRLVIVIDEYRVLAEELPDFVPGLVRLAAVGRSLGIHLVLATQRPGGIVTADIRANVSVRIALRVRDRSDSIDVIERPDAAAVAADTPGRAFLVGAATALTELQTAQVTSTSPAHGRVVVSDVTRWWQSPPTSSTGCDRAPAAATGPAPSAAKSPNPHHQDLDDIVAATWTAARALSSHRPPAPWLPPLPDTLELSDLVGPAGSVPVGLVDIPEQQAQESWCWPMDGHLGVAGGPGSGRTTALRTMAGALASSWSPTSLHLYALGPPSLAALAELPHTAAVAGLHDADHAALVVERLTALVTERVRGPVDRRWPRVVVLVDGWEQLTGLAQGSVAGELRAALEVGRTVGVVAVVTGGRAVLSGQLASLFSSRLVLKVADPVELALAGVPVKPVPRRQPPGRAVVVASHREVQIALLGGTTDETAQDAALATIAARSHARPQ